MMMMMIYTVPWRVLSTLAKKLTPTTREMQSSSNEMALWHPIAQNVNKRKLIYIYIYIYIYIIIPELPYVVEMSERLDIMS